MNKSRNKKEAKIRVPVRGGVCCQYDIKYRNRQWYDWFCLKAVVSYKIDRDREREKERERVVSVCQRYLFVHV